MSSDRPSPPLLAALVLAACAIAPAYGGVLLSVDEALRLAFPDAQVDRESIFLTEDEMAVAADSAGEPVRRSLLVRYVAQREGAVVGTAYLDRHRVRTLEETVFIVVNRDAQITRVEVLSFDEPRDYLPRKGWYGQFSDRGLDDELRLDRGIRAVSGATLTATATTAAARRVLAVHRVVESRQEVP